MSGFIEVTSNNGLKLFLNTRNIGNVHESNNGDGCNILTITDDKSYKVKESYEEVKRMIDSTLCDDSKYEYEATEEKKFTGVQMPSKVDTYLYDKVKKLFSVIELLGTMNTETGEILTKSTILSLVSLVQSRLVELCGDDKSEQVKFIKTQYKKDAAEKIIEILEKYGSWEVTNHDIQSTKETSQKESAILR